jgi:hypothetical protein
VTSSRLTIETLPGRPVPVLAVSGTLELSDTPVLMSALTQGIQASPLQAVICDIRGLVAPTSDALLMVFPAALRRGGGWPDSSLLLAAPRPDLADQLRRLHMWRFVPVHPTLEAAMTAAALPREPIHQHFRFPPDTAGLRAARAAAGDLWPARVRLGGDDFAEAVLLITNELVSNAITHVAEPFTLSFAQSRERALIAVTDPSRNEPILRPKRAASTTGRGLQIIAGLSHDWGVRLVHPRGKTVWASLLTSTGSQG